ncbi:MAG: hypothetical protein K8S54_13085 [Spirochaetia bacterium]|nr:hypothetical protein [Spirochaetia bacterium]
MIRHLVFRLASVASLLAPMACGALLVNDKSAETTSPLLSLLLLARAASSTGATAPVFSFSEATLTPTSSIANYYGAGLTGYSANLVTTSVGPNNPTLIVQAEQNHAVASTYVDFQQSISGFYLTRNVSGTSSNQVGSMTHFYGRSAANYTWNGAAGDSAPNPAATQNMTVAVIAPSNALTLTYRIIKSGIAASTEESAFTADSSTANFALRGMSKSWGTEKKLNVNLIFVSGCNPAGSESGISTAISRMTTLYTQQTVRVRPVITSSTVTLAASYLTLSSTAQNSTAVGSLGGLLAATISAQRTDALNIIFIKNETIGGLLGISSGIVGLPGKAGTRSSGMVVVFDTHLGTPGTTPNASEQQLIGETMAHEGGHWLGLWHTVESNYGTTQNIWNRDAISETPFCQQTPASLANCDFTASNNSGARNVMFWAGATGFSQPDFTGEQGWVLRRHPLVY